MLEAKKPIIRNLSLTVDQGEFVVLIGPSGCGKTTLLKMMNGLIQQDSGEIRIQGKAIKKWNPITLKRNIGYVIQQVGLFPHLTIEKILPMLWIFKRPARSSKRNGPGS
nr:ATP-binding cassette domain-containing protein [uncultured Acetobacterium sp.]